MSFSDQLPLEILFHAMSNACAHARNWLGATTPNPAVGAVALDQNGNILALEAHHRAGLGHAEAKLVQAAKEQGFLQHIHTLCVTLEPCNHTGRTPPCTEAILNSGIRHIAIGILDPNRHVTGGGLARLQNAGLSVVKNIAEIECTALCHPFIYQCQNKTPFMTLKRAFTAEGSMKPPLGQNTFTSPPALALAHLLRKKADVILTSSETILADDPQFTVRHVNDFPEKIRYLAILDRRGRIPAEWLEAAKRRKFIPLIYSSLETAISDLTDRQVNDILVEAGETVSHAILQSGLWAMDVQIQQSKISNQPDQISINFAQGRLMQTLSAAWQTNPESFWRMILPADDKLENILSGLRFSASSV